MPKTTNKGVIPTKWLVPPTQKEVIRNRFELENALTTEPPSSNRMYYRRVIEVELIIDPMEMKSIHKWLESKIREYETVFGRIPSPEEVESRGRRRTEGV